MLAVLTSRPAPLAAATLAARPAPLAAATLATCPARLAPVFGPRFAGRLALLSPRRYARINQSKTAAGPNSRTDEPAKPAQKPAQLQRLPNSEAIELLPTLAFALTMSVIFFRAGENVTAAVIFAGFVLGVMAALLPYIPAQKLAQLPRLPNGEALELLPTLAFALTMSVIFFRAGETTTAAVIFAGFVLGVMGAVLVANRD